MSQERASAPDDLEYGDDDFAGLFEAPDDDAASDAVEASPVTPPVTSEAPPADDPPPTPAPTDTPAASAAPAAPASPTPDATPGTTTETQAPSAVPFTFAVDGQQVTVDGAQVVGDNIVIPKATWDKVVRPRYLGDRNVWRQREASYEQRIKAAEGARSEKEQRAEAVVSRFQELLKQGPEAVAQWLDNFQTNAPLFQAQVEAQVARQQLEALTAQRQEQEQAAQVEQLVPRLQGHLEQTLTQYLGDDKFKVLAADADALKATLWDQAGQLFFEADRDYPEAGLRRGEIGFRYDLFERLLESHAAPARRLAAQAQQVTQAAKVNAAAVAPTRPTPPPRPTQAQPRREDGTFAPKSASEWKNNLLAEDWSDIFSEE